MSTPQPIVVSGWSVHLPEARPHAALPDVGPACPPEQAAILLGRKGLLAKEPATRLALCAVHRALGLAPGARPDTTLDTETAVVASSNLGNMATVAEVAQTVRAQGGRAVSPMSAPNASSNVLAGSVALWFRFGGPNLMLCSGADSGFAAIRLGLLLLRSGRTRRVVVVGAEPDDPVAVALHGMGNPRAPLCAGAACVILETGVPGVQLRLVAGDAPWQAGMLVGAGGLDPVPVWGDAYGAQGILELALAAQLAATRGEPVRAACGTAARERALLIPAGVKP
jgi:3-oxoacyl-[acyl-carrier-protein] synthase II